MLLLEHRTVFPNKIKSIFFLTVTSPNHSTPTTSPSKFIVTWDSTILVLDSLSYIFKVKNVLLKNWKHLTLYASLSGSLLACHRIRRNSFWQLIWPHLDDFFINSFNFILSQALAEQENSIWQESVMENNIQIFRTDPQFHEESFFPLT